MAWCGLLLERAVADVTMPVLLACAANVSFILLKLFLFLLLMMKGGGDDSLMMVVMTTSWALMSPFLLNPRAASFFARAS